MFTIKFFDSNRKMVNSMSGFGEAEALKVAESSTASHDYAYDIIHETTGIRVYRHIPGVAL